MTPKLPDHIAATGLRLVTIAEFEEMADFGEIDPAVVNVGRAVRARWGGKFALIGVGDTDVAQLLIENDPAQLIAEALADFERDRAQPALL